MKRIKEESEQAEKAIRTLRNEKESLETTVRDLDLKFNDQEIKANGLLKLKSNLGIEIDLLN